MHPVSDKPTGSLWVFTVCLEFEHIDNAAEEGYDELCHGDGDQDRDKPHDKREEAGHQCHDTIDDGADSSIEIESHFWYILAEHCNKRYSTHRIFKCCSILRRRIFYFFFLYRVLVSYFLRGLFLLPGFLSVSFFFYDAMEAQVRA